MDYEFKKWIVYAYIYKAKFWMNKNVLLFFYTDKMTNNHRSTLRQMNKKHGTLGHKSKRQFSRTLKGRSLMSWALINELFILFNSPNHLLFVFYICKAFFINDSFHHLQEEWKKLQYLKKWNSCNHEMYGESKLNKSEKINRKKCIWKRQN